MGKVAKDTIIMRFNVQPPEGTPDSYAEKLMEYFSKSYGKCEVAYVWKKGGSDPEYDADGVPNLLNFAVVFKFEESSIANKVKQKYNGRQLFGVRASSGWLENRDIFSLDMPNHLLQQAPPKGGSGGKWGSGGYNNPSTAGGGYWTRDRPVTRSSRPFTPSEQQQQQQQQQQRHPRRSSRGHDGSAYHPHTQVEWYSSSSKPDPPPPSSTSSSSSSSGYGLRSSRQRSPVRPRPHGSSPSRSSSRRGSPSPPPSSPVRTRRTRRHASGASLSRTSSPGTSPPRSASTGSRRRHEGWGEREEGTGEEDRPSSQASIDSSSSSDRPRRSSRMKGRVSGGSGGGVASGADAGKRAGPGRNGGGGSKVKEVEQPVMRSKWEESSEDEEEKEEPKPLPSKVKETGKTTAASKYVVVSSSTHVLPTPLPPPPSTVESGEEDAVKGGSTQQATASTPTPVPVPLFPSKATPLEAVMERPSPLQQPTASAAGESGRGVAPSKGSEGVLDMFEDESSEERHPTEGLLEVKIEKCLHTPSLEQASPKLPVPANQLPSESHDGYQRPPTSEDTPPNWGRGSGRGSYNVYPPMGAQHESSSGMPINQSRMAAEGRGTYYERQEGVGVGQIGRSANLEMQQQQQHPDPTFLQPATPPTAPPTCADEQPGYSLSASQYSQALSMLSELQRQAQQGASVSYEGGGGGGGREGGAEGVGGASSEYAPVWPTREMYAERDVTPPAEVLEATQQLAQGQTDYYQIFQNNPHLLKQFLDCYNAYMQTVTGGGGGGGGGVGQGAGHGEDVVGGGGRGRGSVEDGGGAGYSSGYVGVGRPEEYATPHMAVPAMSDPGAVGSGRTLTRTHSDPYPVQDTPPGGVVSGGHGYSRGGGGAQEDPLGSSDISVLELRGIIDAIATQTQQQKEATGTGYPEALPLFGHRGEGEERWGQGRDSAHQQHQQQQQQQRPSYYPPEPQPLLPADWRETGGRLHEPQGAGPMDLDLDEEEPELYGPGGLGGGAVGVDRGGDLMSDEAEEALLYGKSDQITTAEPTAPPPSTPPPQPPVVDTSEMAIQTEVDQGLEEEEEEGVGPGGLLREVAKQHRDLQLQALGKFSREARQLVNTVKTLVSNNPAMEDVFVATLTTSIRKLSHRVRAELWDKIQQRELEAAMQQGEGPGEQGEGPGAGEEQGEGIMQH